MSKSIICILLSMLLTCASQILLKKGALEKHGSLIKEYLNIYVMTGYAMLGLSVLVGVVAYTGMDYQLGPVFMSLNYAIVMVLSKIIFGEAITKRKLVGNVLIVLGVICFTAL